MDINKVIFDQCKLYYGNFDLTDIDKLIESLRGKELGCSDGGVSFECSPEVRDIPFAGTLERKIKGFQRVLKVDGKVEGEILVLNNELLKMSLFEKKTITSNKLDKYVPVTGLIKNEAYASLLVVGTEAGGEDVIIHIMNTYNSALNLETKDKEEGKCKVVFEAIYEDLNATPPVEIYLPKEVVIP